MLALPHTSMVCIPLTIITASIGKKAPTISSSEALVFEEDFQRFDLDLWKHEITMGGGGNWEVSHIVRYGLSMALVLSYAISIAKLFRGSSLLLFMCH